MIVPFLGNEHDVSALMNGLIEEQQTIKSINARILFICDSPEGAILRSSLEKSVETLSRFGLETQLIINEKNEGFIRSTNKGLKETLALRRDVLLLSSDTILTCGVISELRAACEMDPIVGFVCPRSNNAGISAIASESKKNCILEEGKKIHAEISKHLPRFRYVPSIARFCAYIRYSMFAEFGLLNEDLGDRAENEFVMLANKAGYRAVLANHAYVHCVDEYQLDNFEMMKPGGSEAGTIVQQYSDSPELALEKIYARQIETGTSLSILFDLSNIGTGHHGTCHHAFCVLKALSETIDSISDNIRIFVSIYEQSAIYHGIDQLKNIQLLPFNTTLTFDAAIRIGQPWSMNDVCRLANLAPVNVYFMQDTISWDCSYLNNAHLDTAWKVVLKTANGILFNSEFTKNQFIARFESEGVSSFFSTDPDEYRIYDGELHQNHLTVIGNRLPHKAVLPTVDLLAESFPNQKIMVLGEGEYKWPNVQVFSAGHLSNQLVHSLYMNASDVVFPSHYEGFGFPVMQAIGYGKRVFARNTPLLKEIAKKCPRPDLIVPFDVISDLPQLIKFPKTIDVKPGIPQTWKGHALEIMNYIVKLCADSNVNARLKERLSLLSLITIERCQKLQDRCFELDYHHQRMEKEWKEVLHSTSWKVTAPLRQSMKFIKGLKRGNTQ